MIDINQYLEETNTVLLTKQAFENLLKETTSVVEELEKIKEELNLQGSGRCYGKIFEDEYNRILDKHISKLKGDKK